MKSHVDSQSPGSPNGVDAYVHFFYNQAWQELESRVSASENTGPESLQPQYQYVWSQRYIDAPVLRDKNTDADGLCDDERIYYLGDANFNVTTLVNTGGDALERYVYSPYGVLTIYDATWASIRSTSSYANAYTYTGRQLDSETGLFYYRARFYAAQLGRFCGRDPLGYQAGVNPVEYVWDSPTNRRDSSGLQPGGYLPPNLGLDPPTDKPRVGPGLGDYHRWIRGNWWPWSERYHEEWGQLTRGCIGVVTLYLGIDIPWKDPTTRCFMFPGNPQSALDRAKEYAGSLKCPCGKDPMIWAMNYHAGANPGCVLRPLVRTTNPGDVYIIGMPVRPDPNFPDSTPFDFSIYLPVLGCYVGADQGVVTNPDPNAGHIMYWPNLQCFSTWYPNFDTTVVCATCPKK